jgi:hypothetical protein
MKKLVLLLLMLFVISSVAHAAPKKRSSSRKSSSSYGGSGKIGVGVIIGSISGLNVRILSNGPSAVNFDLAWDRHDNLFVAADYIINNKKTYSKFKWISYLLRSWYKSIYKRLFWSKVYPWYKFQIN